jgi:hypothetical protein
MVGLTGGTEADRDLCELGDANREVDVCQRIVGQPASAVAARILAVDGATVMETSVEAIGAREMRLDAAINSTKLRPCEAGKKECD